MHDLLIRGGTIVDGTGKPAFTGDVAIRAGRVSAVGKDLGSASRTVNADACWSRQRGSMCIHTMTPKWRGMNN